MQTEGWGETVTHRTNGPEQQREGNRRRLSRKEAQENTTRDSGKCG